MEWNIMGEYPIITKRKASSDTLEGEFVNNKLQKYWTVFLTHPSKNKKCTLPENT